MLLWLSMPISIPGAPVHPFIHTCCSTPYKNGQVMNTVVFRGLRLKTGIDTGPVLGEVHAMTGRLTYRCEGSLHTCCTKMRPGKNWL